MKLSPILVALALLSTPAVAQEVQLPRPGVPTVPQRVRVVPQGSSEHVSQSLGANYQLKLTLMDKDAPSEASLVTATRTFNVTVAEQSLAFEGTLDLQDDGTALCTYTLQWVSFSDGTNPKNTSMKASLSILPGQEAEVFRAGNRVVKLSIKKLEIAPPGH